MMTSLHCLFRDQRGDSAIQYALVAGILSVIVLAGSLALRGPIIDLYTEMGSKADDALSAEPAAGAASDQ
jgi:Flp pilus assembly pilin Flp